MSAPNDAASFAAEAKAAMDDLMRARAQSGVARNDPLDPLVLALARTINVLGKMPAAIDQQQKTIITASQAMANKAQADMGVSLSATAETLVNNLGGAVTAREKWKWSALTAVVIGLVAVGSEWLGQTWAVHNAEARADARIAEIEAQTNQEIATVKMQIPQTLAWARTIIPASPSADKAPYPCVFWDHVPDGTIGGRPVYTCAIALGWRNPQQ